jgi:hypothetical protein
LRGSFVKTRNEVESGAVVLMKYLGVPQFLCEGECDHRSQEKYSR